MKNKTLKKQERGKKSFKWHDNFELFMMSLPGIALVFIFGYLPMIGIILAFKDFNPNLGMLKSPWVGFENFEFFFKSSDFTRLMRNTVGYSLWFLIVGNIAAIIIAIMFYNVSKGWKLKYYQTTYILPSFMSIILISYIVYLFLNPSVGFLNQILVKLGWGKRDWYAEPGYWPAILTVVEIWKGVGMSSLLYYATMLGIDDSLFEAAQIDGAGKIKQIIHVLIPGISPLICLNLIRGVGGLIGGDFGLFYQIPRNVGVLYSTTDILNTYVFRALKTGNNFGRTTAVGLFSSVAGVILILITNAIVKKIDEEKSMF